MLILWLDNKCMFRLTKEKDNILMIPLKTSVYRIIDMTLWCTEVNCYSSFTGLMTIFRNQSGMMVILYRSAKSKIKWGTARHVFWNRTRYGQRLEHRHHCYELDPSPPPPPLPPTHTHKHPHPHRHVRRHRLHTATRYSLTLSLRASHAQCASGVVNLRWS